MRRRLPLRRLSEKAEAGARPEGASPAVTRVLVENHARFLGFLERRVGNRDVAQEILQDAFVRGLARGGELRDDESAVAWFYRLLRNALIDHHRHADAERRSLAAYGDERGAEGAEDAELTEVICTCVGSLVETLKPEYADAIRRVELGGEGVSEFARGAGITAGNAAVRVFRARQALRRRIEESCGTCAQHGCWQCECRDQRHSPTASS